MGLMTIELEAIKNNVVPVGRHFPPSFVERALNELDGLDVEMNLVRHRSIDLSFKNLFTSNCEIRLISNSNFR